jgi:fatty-acid peroxygenase
MPPELSLALMRHGYDALPRLAARAADPDAYVVRFLGRNALVVRGEEGARLFYDNQVMTRQGAAPRPLADLLFGRGGVQDLDGEPHGRTGWGSRTRYVATASRRCPAVVWRWP